MTRLTLPILAAILALSCSSYGDHPDQLPADDVATSESAIGWGCATPAWNHRMTNIVVTAATGGTPWAWYSNYDLMEWKTSLGAVPLPSIPSGLCQIGKPAEMLSQCKLRQQFYCPNGIEYRADITSTSPIWATATVVIQAVEAGGTRAARATFNAIDLP